MKKIYSDPEVKVIKIDSKDVICDSTCGQGAGANEVGVETYDF